MIKFIMIECGAKGGEGLLVELLKYESTELIKKLYLLIIKWWKTGRQDEGEIAPWIKRGQIGHRFHWFCINTYSKQTQNIFRRNYWGQPSVFHEREINYGLLLMTGNLINWSNVIMCIHFRLFILFKKCMI